MMIENVRGLLDAKFAYYRELIAARLRGLAMRRDLSCLTLRTLAFRKNGLVSSS